MTKHYKIIGLRILSWVITITGLIIFIGNVHEYGLHFTYNQVLAIIIVILLLVTTMYFSVTPKLLKWNEKYELVWWLCYLCAPIYLFLTNLYNSTDLGYTIKFWPFFGGGAALIIISKYILKNKK